MTLLFFVLLGIANTIWLVLVFLVGMVALIFLATWLGERQKKAKEKRKTIKELESFEDYISSERDRPINWGVKSSWVTM